MKNFQKRKNNKRKNESGNVLFYILIAIVLFAALSFVVGGMMRGGNADMIGEEQAKLYAGEILDYARVVRQAVQDVKISNGCADTEISFENSTVAGYTNGTNTACQIFHPNGGDIRYSPPVDKWGNATEWRFTGRHPVMFVGTDCVDPECMDLIVFLADINKQVCLALNDKLGVSLTSDDAPLDSGIAANKFNGSYANANLIGNEDSNLEGKMAACYLDSDDSTYNFYQVLIAR